MANHGAGNKYFSANLNKSYGNSSGPNNSSYGASRVRSGGQVGGGGGMLVLSRPKSSQKTGPKLSVPSPVNLPSMRKEHEKFDSSGAGGGSAGGAAGNSTRPSSAGKGWSKPAAIVLQEKEKNTEIPFDIAETVSGVDGASRGGSVYMPPARVGSSADGTGSSQLKVNAPVEKAVILRGEDFPSLHTSLSTGPGHTHRQKDGGNQKSKQLSVQDQSSGHGDNANVVEVNMIPQTHTPQHDKGYGPAGNDVGGQRLVGPRLTESQKQESYFHGSLPEVRLNPRSDWADDERDTGHVLTGRNQSHGGLNDDGYWDRDFEMPRCSFMPPKPAPNVFNKRGQRDSETGKVLSSEVLKTDPYNRDARPSSREERDRTSRNSSESHGREGNDTSSWRNSSASLLKAKPQVPMNSGNGFGPDRSLDRNKSGFVEGGRQQWSNTVEPASVQVSSRVVRDQFEGNQFQRHRSNSYQNGSPAKSTFSLGGKGLPMNDPILNFGKVKKTTSKSEDMSLEDPFTGNGYDGRDPFSGELIGLVKRKKDVPKLAEFHDPARESFEAELERVQKMQEQARQRAIEEQERAMELAQREEEERLRLAREQEERMRRLEEEAREAAWRAEQEQLEAIRKAEEQRLAREEEKRRMQMEEERRKQAAKQKLLELEEKIARRQAESSREVATYSVDGTSGPGKEKETTRAADISDWEDGERMVERITTSASSDSSGLNRIDSASGRHSFADNSVLPAREKNINFRRRDTCGNEGSSNFILHNQDSGHHSPGRNVPFNTKKSLPRTDVFGGSGFMYPQNYSRVHDPDMNDPFHSKWQKWNFPGERDQYDSNLEIDAVVHDRFTEKLGDAGWGGSSSSHQTRSIYQERTYQNPEFGEVYSNNRSRYSMRQPRVLPPPSMSSMNKSFNRGEIDRPGIATSLDRVLDSNQPRDSALDTGFDIVRQENVEDPEMVTLRPGHAATRDQLAEGNNSIRCDSQSSLSVTSPPSSPTHLSHEDLEDSRHTPDSSADAVDNVVGPSRSDPVIRNESFFTSAADEEWMVENCEHSQQQEVYDEGGEYQEGDEVRAEEEEDIDLNELEALNFEEKDSPRVSENLILGFNEGVEVGMPSDESEGNQNDNKKFSAPQCINHADSKQSDGHIRARSSTEMRIADEQTGDLAVHSNIDPSISVGSVEATVCSSKPLPGFAILPVSRTDTSSVTAVPNHMESPVKLQFGLFSGPSLIPSPVPSIQIGSIQMPLHLHPPVGSSLPRQVQPLFHFGQLRYNSSISQGLLPLVPQTISFAQSGVTSQLVDNNSAAGSISVQPVQQFSESEKAMNTVQPQSPSSNTNATKTDIGLGFDVKVDSHVKRDSALIDTISSTDVARQQPRIIPPSQFSRERIMNRSKAPGPVSGGRSRENFSASRSFGFRSSNISSVAKPYQNKADKRVTDMDDKMNFGPGGARISTRNSSKKGVFLNKLSKQTVESDWPVSKNTLRETKVDESIAEEISNIGHRMPVEEDIDVTLESGVVRVYEQPGIEVPSDEDDFIEVRSKRQMLNDRREQREKDTRAKFGVTKNIRKPRPTSQNTQAPQNSNRLSFSSSKGPSNEVQSSFVATDGIANAQVSARFKSVSVSQPLGPIGTPSTHRDGHYQTRSSSVKPVQANELPAGSAAEESIELVSAYDNRSNAMENVEASLGPWSKAWVTQQVMPLSQSQLEDAMNPVQFDADGSSSGKPSGLIGMPVSSSSSLMKDEPFSSSASPVNSLLAGKKIQFGAVTSPTVLPPSSRAVSQGVGSLGSGRLEQVSHEPSASGNTCLLYNDAEKCPEEPTHMEISLGQPAASSVAVAAMATSNILGTQASHTASASDFKGFGKATDDGDKNDQKSTSHSKTEESLTVSLPADLSIEMSPISGWQPLQSPQNSSHHMLSHFPGGHPSPFPFYEMNPMAGGPIFAIGPHDKASGSQPQSQKNNPVVSSPLVPWQQHHSGADSFYGHPAGFAPFISQPVGIPGAQGPPHMVVYNHFAPVGQFGQVGLSFMGTTYVPSEKQPDWKHNPTSSAMPAGEENANKMGMNSGQHIHHNIPAASIQHLAPGPSLLQVAPPMAMFEMSQYQQSSDMSGPARWPPVPPHHLHPLPQLLPHPERLMHPQLSNEPPADKPTVSTSVVNRFPDTISSAPASQFPPELGLVESSSSAAPKGSSDTKGDAGKTGSSQSGSSSQNTTPMKTRSHQRKYVPFQQQSHTSGYNSNPHRGLSNSSLRNNNSTGGQTGYHSGNQSSGTERGFHHGKVKQIYVPKQTAANLSS